MISIAAIGQDSHCFVPQADWQANNRPLILGGVTVEGCPPLLGNSDADVILHALTNAVSGLTGERVLGMAADDLCRKGITDSRAYVMLALDSLKDIQLTHLSFSIEAKRPQFANIIESMRREIATLVQLPVHHVTITATSGEEMTAFGRGEGIACICIASAVLPAF
ncbi:MAG: 2-C-methyl-D-erythritol 2,4-cyclodiphosphate synthase [Clostridiaceae bacterium]|nr:2-C-methyl-D-erythritol 2,4-cyclodiphosphate synthase [Clostridiaceae bacterium]